MDGVGADLPRQLDDGLGAEVAVAGGGRADRVGLVGEQDGEAVAVGLGVDDGGADVLLGEGAEDADGDLAAVGDQDLAEAARGAGSGRHGEGRL